MWEPAAWYCKSILWSIESCQKRYPLTSITWLYRGPRCRPIVLACLLRLSANTLLVFKWSQAQVQLFLKFTGDKLCLWGALLKFWFQTDLGRKNSAIFYRQGRQLLLVFLTMVTLWSSPDSSKFDRWNFWKLVYWSLKLTEFCVIVWSFFHWMYKMKHSCYQDSFVINQWFVYLVFGWEMRCFSE